MLISCLLHQSNPRPCSWLQSIHHRGNPWCPFAPCQTLSAMAYPSAGIFPFDAEKPPMASYNFQKTCQCPPRTYKVPRRLPRSSQPWFPTLLCCAPLHKASCCLCAVPAQDAVPLDLSKASSLSNCTSSERPCGHSTEQCFPTPLSLFPHHPCPGLNDSAIAHSLFGLRVSFPTWGVGVGYGAARYRCRYR